MQAPRAFRKIPDLTLPPWGHFKERGGQPFEACHVPPPTTRRNRGPKGEIHRYVLHRPEHLVPSILAHRTICGQYGRFGIRQKGGDPPDATECRIG